MNAAGPALARRLAATVPLISTDVLAHPRPVNDSLPADGCSALDGKHVHLATNAGPCNRCDAPPVGQFDIDLAPISCKVTPRHLLELCRMLYLQTARLGQSLAALVQHYRTELDPATWRWCWFSWMLPHGSTLGNLDFCRRRWDQHPVNDLNAPTIQRASRKKSKARPLVRLSTFHITGLGPGSRT